MQTGKPVIIIGGTTASGKSALALAIAEAFGGAIVNADAMQVYRQLRVLSARPDDAALARAPHRLFGVLDAGDPCSAGRWNEMALAEIEAAQGRNQLPVVVGGSGLYLRALAEGIDEIPPVSPEIRKAVRDRHAAIGGAAFHAELGARDPRSASRLRPTDSQRLIRAAEVLRATGRTLGDWQGAAKAGPPAGLRFLTIVLAPPREILYPACDARFEAMVEGGAIDEVRALMALALDPGLPVMKAVGVRELGSALAGEASLADAIAAGQQATRRYAKRQYTWFRHQSQSASVINEQYSESLLPQIFNKIRLFC
ncbi:MAG: tRNA (adenosine(37)-N6)-dimethylallyltransferase MiaA [Alphaproteobacteria bacterium]